MSNVRDVYSTIITVSATTTHSLKDILEAAEHHDLKAIKNFLERNSYDLMSTNPQGQTAAHIAAKNGDFEIVKCLVDKDSSLIKIRDKWNQSILHLAIQNGNLEVVKYLVNNHNVNVFEQDNIFSVTPAIHIAAAVGKLDILKYFVEEVKIDVNFKNSAGQPPAFSAAKHNHIHIVKYFVEETDANLYMIDNNGDNIFFVVAMIRDLSIPKYLLDEKKFSFDINWRGERGETVVGRAAAFTNIYFIRYLVGEKQANVNIADNEGKTPLHEAASLADFVTVKYLVENGANVELKNNRGETALDVAAGKRVLKYLQKKQNKRRRNRRSARQPLSYTPQVHLLACSNLVQQPTVNGGLISRHSAIIEVAASIASHANSFFVLAGACVTFFFKRGFSKTAVENRENSIALEAINSSVFSD